MLLIGLTAQANRADELQSRLFGLQSEITRLNNQIDVRLQDITRLQLELDSLESEYGLSLSQNAQLRSQVNQLQEQLNRLKRVTVLNFPTSPIYYDLTQLYPANLACTGSMRPTFECGDLVLLYAPGSPSELRIGDIAVYHIGSQYTYCDFAGLYIIHRIMSFDGTYYWFKGDANSSEDDCGIPFGLITAKVVGIIYDAS